MAPVGLDPGGAGAFRRCGADDRPPSPCSWFGRGRRWCRSSGGRRGGLRGSRRRHRGHRCVLRFRHARSVSRTSSRRRNGGPYRAYTDADEPVAFATPSPGGRRRPEGPSTGSAPRPFPAPLGVAFSPGRDGPFGPPPGQNPACRFPAPGSHLRSTDQRVVLLAVRPAPGP
jgi:hypothetical protein